VRRPSRPTRPCCYRLGEEEEGIPWRKGMAPNRRRAMTAIRSRSEARRTCRMHCESDAIDPIPDIDSA
jgi:hypothetical protein